MLEHYNFLFIKTSLHDRLLSYPAYKIRAINNSLCLSSILMRKVTKVCYDMNLCTAYIELYESDTYYEMNHSAMRIMKRNPKAVS